MRDNPWFVYRYLTHQHDVLVCRNSNGQGIPLTAWERRVVDSYAEMIGKYIQREIDPDRTYNRREIWEVPFYYLEERVEENIWWGEINAFIAERNSERILALLKNRA